MAFTERPRYLLDRRPFARLGFVPLFESRSPVFVMEEMRSSCQHRDGTWRDRSMRPLSQMPRHNEVVHDPWPVVTVDDWSVAGLETQGQHPHDWLKHPSQKRTWLFKPARPERDRSLGEDVVEKLASELARLIGIPAAPVELAVRDGVRGALVEDVRLSNWELQAGQALIPEVVPDYDPDDPGRRGHNIETIRQALTRFAIPPDSLLPAAFRAFDTFVGYLVFDALIAHGDRHDRNWAVLVPPLETDHLEALCPSFDHAASLGFTLTDELRAQHLRDGTVPRWGKPRKGVQVRASRWLSLADTRRPGRVCDFKLRTSNARFLARAHPVGGL